MAKYTVAVQETQGADFARLAVESDDVQGAIRVAAEYRALHGHIECVEVYPGHDGWYQASERLWVGSLEWSQASDDDCEMIEAVK